MDEVSGEYVYMKYEEKKVKSNTWKILCAPSKKFKKRELYFNLQYESI